MSKTVLVFWFLMAMFASSFANNNYFIPGDAFFYFEIDEAEWESFKKGELTVWQYDRPDHLPFMFCGYAGYLNLDASSLPEQYRGRLIHAVDSMKALYPTKTVEKEFPGFGVTEKEKVEINKIRVFVYNKSFDFSKRRIGLKYNESWPKTAKMFGHGRDHFQFDFFVNSSKAITESWRLGSTVPSLEAKLPPVETKGAIKSPIPFDANKLQFLIAPPVPIESLCYPKRDSKLQCFLVGNDGASTMVVDKNGWEVRRNAAE